MGFQASRSMITSWTWPSRVSCGTVAACEVYYVPEFCECASMLDVFHVVRYQVTRLRAASDPAFPVILKNYTLQVTRLREASDPVFFFRTIEHPSTRA